MDQPEVEVLEPVTNWEKEVGVQVEVDKIQVPVQRIIINDEERVIMGDVYVIKCPKCGNIVQQFPVGLEEADVVLSLNTDKENYLNGYLYCTHCGQKLRIFRPMPVDGEFTVEDVKDSE